MSEWKEYKLSELIQSVSKTYKFSNEQVCFLNTSDTLEGKVINHNFFDPNDLPGQAKKSIALNDILYSEIRPANKRYAYIDFNVEKYVVSTKLMVLRIIKSEVLTPKYLFYFLTSDEIVQLLQMLAESRSGTFPQIRFEEVSLLEIKLPPIAIQNSIVELISSIDDKIELNNKINKELETLAQTLFKQWFIDFEFPNENGEPYKSSGGEMVDSELGEIPKGWEVKRLSEIVKLTGGGTPKRSEDKYWNGEISWFSVQDVPSNSDVIVIDTKEKITIEGLNNSSTKILPVGTTIITARGTVGKLAFVASPMAMNQSCYGVNGIDNIGPIFNYLNLFKSLDELKRNTHGAVFDTITSSTFDTIKTLLPDSKTLNYFENALNPLFSKFEENAKENNDIKNLRDTLLPKLILGELEINEIAN
jgi:type I restriction enzyme S subunit